MKQAHQSPEASIIIPVFNGAATIEAAVASACAQTLRDIEIIVVDDASTDGTAAIVEAIAVKDPRVRLVRAPVNGGPGAARNLGFDQAQGEWVGVLDADDTYLPGRMGHLLALARASGADVVSDNLLLKESGQRDRPMFPVTSLPTDGVLDGATFILGNLGRRGAARTAYGFMKPLIRRGFLNRHGIHYDRIRFSEDFLLAVRLFINGARWVVAPEPYYHYTVRPDSLTADHSTDELRKLAMIERELIDLPGTRATPALRRALLRHCRTVDDARQWRCFAEALKRRQAREAIAVLTESPRGFLHIGAQALHTVARMARA